MEKENLKDILEKVNKVDAGVNNLIIPILKDTIKDSNKTNTKLFIFAILELFIILITTITSIIVVYNQNSKYQEFLSQFDFAEETITQDLDATDGGSINNSSITTR